MRTIVLAIIPVFTVCFAAQSFAATTRAKKGDSGRQAAITRCIQRIQQSPYYADSNERVRGSTYRACMSKAGYRP
jgi:hypothetical protein